MVATTVGFSAGVSLSSELEVLSLFFADFFALPVSEAALAEAFAGLAATTTAGLARLAELLGCVAGWLFAGAAEICAAGTFAVCCVGCAGADGFRILSRANVPAAATNSTATTPNSMKRDPEGLSSA